MTRTPCCTLVPIDLWNDLEFTTLRNQRVLCGWNNDTAKMEAWRSEIDAHALSMYWIMPLTAASTYSTQNAGHIGLDSPEKSPKSTSEKTPPERMISNFFILSSYRSSGLGRAAVQAIEQIALDEAAASSAGDGRVSIILNTHSRRYIEDDSPEWRGYYAKVCKSIGKELPVMGRGASNEDWYGRMGYIRFREEPLFPVRVEGEDGLLVAVWMRKVLGVVEQVHDVTPVQIPLDVGVEACS